MFNVYDLVDLADLNTYIRALDFPEFTLDRWLPNREVDRTDFRYITNDRTPQPAASFLAWDAEAPIGGRPGATIRTGQLPPIKEKAVLTESDQFLVERLTQVIGDAMVASIFADGVLRTRAILQRLQLAKGEALSRGRVTINERGLILTVDFGVPAAHMDVAPATLWSNRSTSTPLTNLVAWRQTYVDNTGEEPGALVTSTAVAADLQANAEIIGAIGGTTAGRTRVNREELNGLLASEGLPPVTVYDAQYRDTSGTKVRAIPADRLLFLPAGSDGFGEAQLGRTREAVELARAGWLAGDGQPAVPGIAVSTMKTFDPVEIWVKAAAVALPVIQQPELIFSADVR